MPKKYSHPAMNPAPLPRLRLAEGYAQPAGGIRRGNPMTTKASARQAMPPSRNAKGVEPPLVAATPDTLSSIAMPGASTETEIAIASGSRRVPRASASSRATLGPELIWAMGRFLTVRVLLGHEDVL